MVALDGDWIIKIQMLSGVNINQKRQNCLLFFITLKPYVLPTGHIVLPIGMASRKSLSVASKTAYASNSIDIDQKGNGYKWESWEAGGERCKEQTNNY